MSIKDLVTAHDMKLVKLVASAVGGVATTAIAIFGIAGENKAEKKRKASSTATDKSDFSHEAVSFEAHKEPHSM